MAPHCSDSYADTVDRYHLLGLENLVGLGYSLPFLLGLAVIKLLVDPWDYASCQRNLEVCNRHLRRPHCSCNCPVHLKNLGCRIIDLVPCSASQELHLSQKLLHILCSGTAGCLICHGCEPFHQIVLEKSADSHEHKAYSAVSAYESLDSILKSLINDWSVHRVQDDDAVVCHAQCGCSVDPVALPACGHELRINLLRIAASLACDNNIHLFEFVDIVSVLENSSISASIFITLSSLGR